jgi:hypothetical protein
MHFAGKLEEDGFLLLQNATGRAIIAVGIDRFIERLNDHFSSQKRRWETLTKSQHCRARRNGDFVDRRVERSFVLRIGGSCAQDAPNFRMRFLMQGFSFLEKGL